jgi:hypothetical protein
VDGDHPRLGNTDRLRVADYYGCTFANAHGHGQPAADRNAFSDGNSDLYAGANTGRRRADVAGADLDVSLRLNAAL